MSEQARLLEVAELDLGFEHSGWEFAERQAAAIATHWARLTKAKPSLFNGRVLLLGERVIETRPDGKLKLKGVYFETDYADFLAWSEFGHPGGPVDNCFAMAALRSDDGAFLLGEMAHHTYNAGQIYFPAGTPDPDDVFDDRVDLEASARRELLEETGLLAAETNVAPSWTVVVTSSAHSLHETDDISAARHSAQGADRGVPGARPSGRVRAHAYRARPGRHRRHASAEFRR